MQRFFDINLFFLDNKSVRVLKSKYKRFMNIVLVGYMGSGKSTIGRKLSEILDFNYLDLDDYIQSKEEMTISEIFETKGEIYFRKIESLYLKEVLEIQHVVLSLGGGTPCYGLNMDMIAKSNHSTSIYLKTSIPTLAKRLENEKSSRPLISHLKTEEQLVEFIGKHLFERSVFYGQSDLVVNTDDKSTLGVVEEIIMTLF